MKSLFWLSSLIALFFAWQFSVIPAVYAGEGHDAGYRWAELHDIRDTGYNNGNSESFNEGVREYAEEHAEDQHTGRSPAGKH